MTVVLRPAVEADADAVLALVLARDVADIGAPDFSLEHLLADWRMPEVDLTADGWIAEDGDGTLTGYALLADRDLIVTVRPGCESRGIGTALRTAGEARAQAVGTPAVRQVTAGVNDDARAAMAAAGYERIQQHERLEADLANITPPAEPLAVRAFVPDRDAEPVWRLAEAAFGERADHVPTSFAGWRAQGMERGDFDPALWLLHEDAEGLAGIALADRWEEDRGYVETLAVAARARRRGLGRRLLAASLEVLRADGVGFAHLNVDLANAPATTLYASVGFRPQWRMECWEKGLA